MRALPQFGDKKNHVLLSFFWLRRQKTPLDGDTKRDKSQVWSFPFFSGVVHAIRLRNRLKCLSQLLPKDI